VRPRIAGQPSWCRFAAACPLDGRSRQALDPVRIDDGGVQAGAAAGARNGAGDRTLPARRISLAVAAR